MTNMLIDVAYHALRAMHDATHRRVFPPFAEATQYRAEIVAVDITKPWIVLFCANDPCTKAHLRLKKRFLKKVTESSARLTAKLGPVETDRFVTPTADQFLPADTKTIAWHEVRDPMYRLALQVYVYQGYLFITAGLATA